MQRLRPNQDTVTFLLLFQQHSVESHKFLLTVARHLGFCFLRSRAQVHCWMHSGLYSMARLLSRPLWLTALYQNGEFNKYRVWKSFSIFKSVESLQSSSHHNERIDIIL